MIYFEMLHFIDTYVVSYGVSFKKQCQINDK